MYSSYTLLTSVICVGLVKAMYLDFASVCPNSTIIIDLKPKIEKNGKQNVHIHLYSPMTIGSNTKVHTDVFVMRTSGWVKIWDLWANDFCKFINRYGASALADLFRRINIRPNVCPIVKMNSTITDYVFDWEKIGYKILPKGRFRADVNIYKRADNINVGCFTMAFTNK